MRARDDPSRLESRWNQKTKNEIDVLDQDIILEVLPERFVMVGPEVRWSRRQIQNQVKNRQLIKPLQIDLFECVR